MHVPWSPCNGASAITIDDSAGSPDDGSNDSGRSSSVFTYDCVMSMGYISNFIPNCLSLWISDIFSIKQFFSLSMLGDVGDGDAFKDDAGCDVCIR